MANQRDVNFPYRAVPGAWFHPRTPPLDSDVRATAVSRRVNHCGNHRRRIVCYRKFPLSFLYASRKLSGVLGYLRTRANLDLEDRH